MNGRKIVISQTTPQQEMVEQSAIIKLQTFQTPNSQTTMQLPVEQLKPKAI